MTPEPRLWICREHERIGSEEQARAHAAECGCDVAELDQVTSDAVRAEWAKDLTRWDVAIAATLLARGRTPAPGA
jgi:hypothetical protein